MTETNIKDLKPWRKKHGLSQRKLANLAKINVITLRQIETGKGKQRVDTLKKLQDAIKVIEAKPVAEAKPAKAKKRKATVEVKTAVKPPAPMIDLKSFRKRHGLFQAKLSKLAKVSLNTILNMEAGKGKPRTDTLEKIMLAIKDVEGKPVPKTKPTRKIRVVKAKRKGRGKSRKTTETGPIKLSNIDLELLNRILNMSESEKIELLKKMM